MLGVVRGPFARERRLITRFPDLGPGAPLRARCRVRRRLEPVCRSAARCGAHGRGPLRPGRARRTLAARVRRGHRHPVHARGARLRRAPRPYGRLQRAGASIERVAGVLLVVLGALLATGLYAHVTSYFVRARPVAREPLSATRDSSVGVSPRDRPGSSRPYRRCRSSRPGSWRGTAGGSPRRRRTAAPARSSVVISP